MSNNGNLQESPVCFQFPEAIRLLWEGAWKAAEESGIDRSDLASLCDIVVRLADHRLLVIEANASPPGSEKVAAEVRRYRDLAADLHRTASAPPPEPPWDEVAAKLRSAGAAPLAVFTLTKE